MTPLLLGNSFPFSLIRAPVRIEPRSMSDLRAALKDAEVHSFWGHANTASAAEALAGVTLSRPSERPALTLSEDRKPMLDGIEFPECWILSPDYPPGFRPAIGEEVTHEKISGWQILFMEWFI